MLGALPDPLAPGLSRAKVEDDEVRRSSIEAVEKG
jgi:hypothetical protein